MEGENFFQCWERFKELLTSCPHHGYAEWHVINIFYAALTPQLKQFVETMCAGTFMDMQPHEAYFYFDYLANLTRDWDITGTQNPKSRVNTQGVKYQLKDVDDVNTRLATMARKLEALEFNKVNSVGSEEPKEVYGVVCETKKHDTMSCPVIPGIKEALHEKEKLPAQPQPKPSRQVHSTETSNQPSSSHDQVQAITVLTNGKVMDKTILSNDPKGKGETYKVVKPLVEKKLEPNEGQESEVEPRDEKKGSGKRDDEREEKIEFVPDSEGTLRENDLCTVMRKLNVRENAFRVKNVQSVVQVKTPSKCKDPGCPTVTCVIGDHKIKGCLLDLGSSVNLLPYSVYEQLGLGRQPRDLEDVREVNLIDSIVHEYFERQNIEDPLARMLIFSEGLDYLEIEEGGDVLLEDNGVEMCPVMAAGQWIPTFEPLIPNPIKPQPSEDEAPTPKKAFTFDS
ncbi:hypothetical protein Acr_21g0003460 [Actinidia rufa]|uniref:Retrotransposon gag domain-containing protein n=1 Tax=Actinidia rufa TaxID=165716 RepID=A0A7J0GG01_9ERIC|nr:hypothetical protein Acr_21g0003460 [Actinidia rufa]